MNLIKEIKDAEARISPYILNTPLFHSTYLSELNKGKVYLKLESEQITGSFKARGALNRMLGASADEKNRGFITASSGNHAQGFANALSITGGKGTIYLPENADKSKVEALGHFDVSLEYYGNGCLETELKAKQVSAELGATWISPYNDVQVIAGQGTLAVEVTDILSPDVVMACIGGGGMMSGVSTWFKNHSPDVQIIGCLPENSPEMYHSVKENRIVEMEPRDTLSDGSAGGLEPGAITFDICKENVDDFCLVSEQQIADAIKLMVHKHHKIIEGAAGVTIASFAKMTRQLEGKTVVLVVCGCNISTEKLARII